MLGQRARGRRSVGPIVVGMCRFSSCFFVWTCVSLVRSFVSLVWTCGRASILCRNGRCVGVCIETGFRINLDPVVCRSIAPLNPIVRRGSVSGGTPFQNRSTRLHTFVWIAFSNTRRHFSALCFARDVYARRAAMTAWMTELFPDQAQLRDGIATWTSGFQYAYIVAPWGRGVYVVLLTRKSVERWESIQHHRPV